MSVNVVAKVIVVLSNTNDQNKQIEVIKAEALYKKIQQFVNLSLPKENVPYLTKPPLLTLADVNPNTRFVKDLTSKEKKEYNKINRNYTRQLKIFNK